MINPEQAAADRAIAYGSMFGGFGLFMACLFGWGLLNGQGGTALMVLEGLWLVLFGIGLRTFTRGLAARRGAR